MSSDPISPGSVGSPALMFGVPIADLTMDEAIDLIGRLVDEGRDRGVSHQIATVNVDFLVNALHDPSIRSILQEADVCIADGTPIVWGASLLGMPITERVAGADLVPRLFDVSQSTGWRIHVFGSSPPIAARAESLIAVRYPRADVSIDPGPIITDVEDVDGEILDSIADVDADIVCVALGNPKQERFIRAHRDRIAAPVMIGVGGSLDMFVGARKRAPAWVQRIGLEWVVRAMQEPRRLGRRYAHDIGTFSPAFAREWRANRRRRSLAGLSIRIGEEAVEVHLGGSTRPGEDDWRRAASRIADGASLRIDARRATDISDGAAAQLVGLVGVSRWFGREIVWSDPPVALDSPLTELGVTPAMVACVGAWRPERTE